MNQNRMIKLLICFSLFASVTNFLPLSVSYCLLILLLIPLFFPRIRIKSVLLPLVFLYTYFLISVIFYHPQSLVNPSFYRRDGNFFITFLPLLVLAQRRKWFNTETIVRRFIYFATAVNLACMLLPRIGFNPSNIIIIENTTVNHFLFEAHNAAGGFIGVLLSFCVGYLFAVRNERIKGRIFACCLINGVALLDSGSRGTLVAFIAAMALFIIMRKKLKSSNKKNSADKVIFILVLVADIAIVAIVSDEKLFKFILNSLHITKRIENIGDRLSELWPKALRLYSASPLFGTGYGSYNDEPIHLSVIIKNILAINHPIEYVYDPAHAHNTFLHVMAETGTAGLVILVLLINSMRGNILRIRNKPLKYGLYIGLCMNVFSSFTEHRFFTPAQMIPYVLVLGMTISEERSEKFKNEMQAGIR